MLFNYYMPTKIVFQNNCSMNAINHIPKGNILIICDPFFHANGTAKKIGDAISGGQVTYFSGVEPNPSCESVDLAAILARKISAKCIIGLGGGSALDVAKMVACLATEEGSIYDYYAGGTKTFKKRTTSLVCIPTTAGTGSEVTNVGVYTNKKTGLKVPMVTDEFWADIALLDPELTASLPAVVTASSGMDAFCHAIEAYWNKNSQPLCDVAALSAMKLIVGNIETAYTEPTNKDARSNMLLASLMAGVAFSQTRTTGIHALSFPLTVKFGLSHGEACAITLPAFIRASVEECQDKMDYLAKYLGCEDTNALADKVEKTMRAMKMPTRLSQAGVKVDDIADLAAVGLGAAVMQLTPATMNEQTVAKLLESIL